MDKILVRGGKLLNGELKISGSKNSALSILAATLLTDEKCVIRNVPHLRDINTMRDILNSLDVSTEQNMDSITTERLSQTKYIAPYELVKKMRASICVLGPLLAKLGEAEVSLPGGCIIGPRPIDLHLKGLRALGADIDIDHGYIKAKCDGLKGAEIYLGGPFGSSVLGTANVMMAAVLAEGTTIIEDAACEPEIVELADFLIKMGADIKGHGTYKIKINGRKELKGAEYDIIPDRIEVGTYMIAGAITGGQIKLLNCNANHLNSVIDKLLEAGVELKIDNTNILVSNDSNRLSAVDVVTSSYPGFPTDMQAQMMALMSVADGTSIVTEKIYPERFLHISELNRMGADITLEGNSAIIKGVSNLSGAQVMASDLRASAALVLASLVAEGETIISRIYHLDRGYQDLEKKLSNLGADIERIK